MPARKPYKGEQQKAFIDRCMDDEKMKDEYPKPDQRYAVCVSNWNRKGKGKK